MSNFLIDLFHSEIYDEFSQEDLDKIAALHTADKYTDELVAAITYETVRNFSNLCGIPHGPAWNDLTLQDRDDKTQSVAYIRKNPYINEREMHELWKAQKEKDGWTKGEYNYANKTHPCITTYDKIPKEFNIRNKILLLTTIYLVTT